MHPTISAVLATERHDRLLREATHARRRACVRRTRSGSPRPAWLPAFAWVLRRARPRVADR